MRRILLVLEDYGERAFIETLFRKIGIDCSSVQNDAAVNEKILEFGPEVVIATARGRRVVGTKLVQRVRRSKGIPKFILFYPPNFPPTAEELKTLEVESWISTPIQPRELLIKVALATGVNPEVFIEKIDKLGLFDTSTPSKGESTLRVSESQRTEAELEIMSWRGRQSHNSSGKKDYSKYLGELPLNTPSTISREAVARQTKLFRQRANDPEIKEIDESRRDFVRALFRSSSKISRKRP